MTLFARPMTAPGPGAMVDPQHPLGHGCVGCWWPNAAPDAGRGLWIPDLSGHGQHAQFAGSLPLWAASRNGAWGVDIKSDAARWLKVPLGPAANRGTEDFSVVVGITPEATLTGWPNAIDCRTKGEATYGWSYCLRFYKAKGAAIDFCDADSLHYALSNDGTEAYTGGAWNVLAITCDRDGLATSYKNGAAHGTADISPAAGQVATPQSSGYLRIGADLTETSQWRLVGVYEFVYIYDRVLPPEEVAWLYREPAAMLWEPGPRHFLVTSAAEEALSVSRSTEVFAAESFAVSRSIEVSAADQLALSRAMETTAQEILTLTRALELSAAEQEQLTRALEAFGLEALSATRGVEVSAQEIQTLTRAVETYAQDIANITRTVLTWGGDTQSVTRELAVVGAELLTVVRGVEVSAQETYSLTRDLAVSGADVLSIARTVATWGEGGETEFAVARGVVVWAISVAVGVRDTLLLLDHRDVLKADDSRDNLRTRDERDNLKLQ